MSAGTTPRVSRRAVLGAIGGTAVAVATAGAVTWDRWWSSGGGHHIPPHAEGIARIGHVYLAGTPEEADPDRLRELLAGTEAGELTGDETELTRLQPVVRSEARDDDLVIVDGWVLSRSEARAAGLVALMGR